MHGDHSGKNQTKAIIPVIDEYLLKAKLGYFDTNNASSNDTCFPETIDLIRPDLNAKKRRLRCIGHIINLIAKGFISGNKSEFFEQMWLLQRAPITWRQQWSFGKTTG